MRRTLAVAALTASAACTAPTTSPRPPENPSAAVAPPAVAHSVSAAPSAGGGPAPVAAPAPGGAEDKPAPPPPQPPGAKITPLGTSYRIDAAGTGPRPTQNDRVTAHVTVWTSAGRISHDSTKRDQPMRLDLRRVEPRLREAVGLLSRSGKGTFWIRSLTGAILAGQEGERSVFEIEVLAIEPAAPVPTDLTRPPPSAKAIAGGVRVLRLSRGAGRDRPGPDHWVTLTYAAWDETGREFDVLADRGVHTVQRRDTYDCFHDVLATMVAGDKVRAWIPAGAVPRFKDPAQGAAVFEIELVRVEKHVPPPTAPSDVARPPARASTTARGTRYRVLRRGTGTQRPGPTDAVHVRHTGWSVDGKRFTDDISHMQPVRLALDNDAAWADAVQTMVVGGKTRFWFVAGAAPSALFGPAGMVVYDVELMAIVPADMK